MAGLTEIAGFGGEVLRPQDAGYGQARCLWNGAVDKRPALIARCTGAADVRAGIEHARSSGLPLAIRGGGHNVAGTASCDGGLVLDLSPMKGRPGRSRRPQRLGAGRVCCGASWTRRRSGSGWPPPVGS